MNRLFLMTVATLSLYSGTQAAADDELPSYFYKGGKEKALEINRYLNTLPWEELGAVMNSNTDLLVDLDSDTESLPVERALCRTPTPEERSALLTRNYNIYATLIDSRSGLRQQEVGQLRAEMTNNIARQNAHSVILRTRSELLLTNGLILHKICLEYNKTQNKK